MKVSKTVDEAVKDLWALLASAAAKKAVSRIAEWGDEAGAEQYANATAKWLAKAGANATKWTYQRPPR